MGNEQAIIEVENLVKAYGLRPALKGVNFSVQRGEFLRLLGANGSGKSTLLRTLSGLSKPTSGRIRIGGWEMPREAMAVRAQIGLVAHQPLLYDNLTARENLHFFGKLYAIDADEREQRSADLLRRVELHKRADSLVRTFSRGMKQRLSIARALVHQPDLLLLDEPYSGLDQDAGALLDDLLAAARQHGQTIIMSTHQLERASTATERSLILSGGRISFDGLLGGDETADVYRQASEAPIT